MVTATAMSEVVTLLMGERTKLAHHLQLTAAKVSKAVTDESDASEAVRTTKAQLTQVEAERLITASTEGVLSGSNEKVRAAQLAAYLPNCADWSEANEDYLYAVSRHEVAKAALQSATTQYSAARAECGMLEAAMRMLAN